MKKLICSTCKAEPARPGQRNCTSCHSAYMRSWRKSHPLNPEQRRKMNCRSYAHVYLKRGHIDRKPCRVCGKVGQMHHSNYDKPLQIEWLCREHHLAFHQQRLLELKAAV